MAIEPETKQAVRERVWDRLQREGASSDPHGRIPDFLGAAATAQRLAALPAWQRAHVLKTNPDQAQLPVRALRKGKLLYMAVPKLADPLPFFRLDPTELDGEPEVLAAHRTAAPVAPKVAVGDMHPVDLIVCGRVAVNLSGVRIGKGAGYSDIDVALLAQAGRGDHPLWHTLPTDRPGMGHPRPRQDRRNPSASGDGTRAVTLPRP
jgi:5-formyltetrahydrofolate cyclo-ligase